MRRLKDRPWYHVKAALAARGTSLAAVSRQLGKTPSAMTKVKTVPLPALQAAIADVLGEKPQVIWPSRYDRFGQPVGGLTWLLKHNPRFKFRHCQNGRAA